MGLVRKLNAAARVSGTLLSYATYRPVVDPDGTRAFFRVVARTIVDFRPPPLFQLPEISFQQLCPGIDGMELPIRVSVPGPWEPPLEESRSLARMVRCLRPVSVLEIGTFRGRTTRLIAEHTEGARIYTIDLPPERARGFECFERSASEMIGEAFRHHPVSSRITQLFADSRTFDFHPLYEAMDFIFIDGDHHYATVKHDTEQALRMLKPGGVIVWDDYQLSQPGVMRCLNELAKRKRVYHLEGTRFACHRANTAHG